MKNSSHLFAQTVIVLGLLTNIALADVTLPNVFGNHMVLQQNKEIIVWGWADSGESVTVDLSGDSASVVADKNGDWKVKLNPRKADHQPLTLTVSGKNRLSFEDVLMGEVWVCSGQSNMGWPVANSFDADLESLSANHPELRIISVPQVGTQELQKNFKG